MEENIKILHDEIDWLEKVTHQVISSYLMQEGHENKWIDIPLPDLDDSSETYYGAFVKEWNLNVFDRLALALTLAVHLKPNVLDVFFGKNKIYDRPFTEFGGVMDNKHSGFLPTGQTFLFLTTSSSPELMQQATKVLDRFNILMKEQVLLLESVSDYIPRTNGILHMNNSWLNYFVSGKRIEMEHSATFPASKISTPLEWGDIVLNRHVIEQVNEIRTWLTHGAILMEDWGLDRMLKPGFRSLFYGPPGTGKTLTATLLGKASNRDVYRVDLSMIVSKYIGETEKNLSGLFDIAQHKDWILFFDEADALFGKRTEARSSNDRHANQQTAYLLQRIEDFPGVVILASNLKGNIDAAFTRRFQSMIHFPMPSARERYKLWFNAFSGKCSLGEDIDLEKISEDIQLTGGSIINVLRYCALSAIKRNKSVIQKEELLYAIKRELKKMDRTLHLA